MLSSTDLPEPLLPMMTWVSPRLTRRSTPRSTCLSPKDLCRLRNSTRTRPSLAPSEALVVVGAIFSEAKGNQDLRHEDVGDEDHQRGGDHGVGGRAPDAARAALGAEAVER